MAKNVALSAKACKTLSRLKGKDESFSKVVLRLAGEGKASSLSSFAGLWKGDREAERIYAAILKERHEKKARWVSV